MRTKFYLHTLALTSIVFFLHFRSEAQSEITIKDTMETKNNLIYNNLFPNSLTLSAPLSPNLFDINLFTKESHSRYQFKPQPKQSHSLLFSQTKNEFEIPSLGFSHQFNNTFTYTDKNKITASAGIGFVHQNSILNTYMPNYQLSFKAYFEYELTDWLKAYFYGQYVTRSLTVDNKFIDPLMLWNPIFVKTEMGAGLQAKYKNIKLDVGMKKTFNTQVRNFNVQSMDSKLILGF